MSFQYVLTLSGTTKDNTSMFLEAMGERCELVVGYGSDFGETYRGHIQVDRRLSNDELSFLCMQSDVDQCILESIQ